MTIGAPSSGTALKALAAAFDKVDATPSDVPGLTFSLLPGTYVFEADLDLGQTSTGGYGFQLNGTAVFSALFCYLDARDVGGGTGNAVLQRRFSAFASLQFVNTSLSNVLCRITGSIVVTTAGTFLLQFAQGSIPAGISSIRAGSCMTITPVPA